LSEIGASLATQVAVQELLSPLPKDALFESDHALEEEFARTFPERVTESWLVRVQEDAKSRLGESYTAVDPEATIRRYGTTLLVTRVSPRWIMLAQIGDGDILFLSLDDRIVYPLETENALVGLSTYSLASRNAISLWKTAVLPREGGLLLLATDGLSDSFGGSDHPEFQRFVRSLRQRIGEYGIGKVAHSLPTWLSQYSDQGSGDDVTLVLMDIMPEEGGNNQTVEDTDGTPNRSEN